MSLDRIRAPYGFVPLSSKVVFPEWADRASQDWPLEGALRGHLDVEIEALSPIFVRGSIDEKRFFQAPDGTLGIPGSSWRGMLRNVVEIATFGKLNRFGRRRFGVRDLHNRDVYGQHMADILTAPNGKKLPMPLVNAGWLVPVEDHDPDDPNAVVARIEACHFAKIEYEELNTIAREIEVSGFDPGIRQSAARKYQTWKRSDGRSGRLSFPFRIKSLRERGRDARLVSDYGVVVGPGETKGTLVFTGQPSRYDPRKLNKRKGAGNPKHHDFVFHGRAGRSYDVTQAQFQDFEFIHSDGGEQHKLTGRFKPNQEWGFWQKVRWNDTSRDVEKRRVPVFFLLDKHGKLRAFGLAMMFRLAYLHSVEDAVRRGQEDFDSATPDFAETLFGYVRDGKGGASSDALKGRVSFGFAQVVGRPKAMGEVRAVLGTPKASYYPNYLEQNPNLGHGARPSRGAKGYRYKTYMDPDAVVRGWKRYRPIEGHEVLRPPLPTKGDGSAMDTSKVETRFAPLPAKTSFLGKLRLHNVLPEELGALLWAMDLGGGDDVFHKLGLGRSLGYGTVRLRVRGARLVDNDDRPFTDLDACREAFRRYMEQQVPGWQESPQVRELVALARPIRKSDARHMLINHPEHRNEFSAAKKAGLALSAAAPSTPGANKKGGGEAAGPRPTARQAGGPWKDLPRGHRMEVTLTEQNRKGKWRFAIDALDAKGTLVQGEPPPGVQAGQTVTVVVIRAATRSSIEARWP